MKRLFLKILIVFSLFTYSQQSYKYVIIPKKFSFFNEENKYETNQLTKSFFQTEGYTVLYDTDVFPQELAQNRCLALYADAIAQNNMFTTKIQIIIKDCANEQVYVSEFGTSREKQYSIAYKESFREALSSMKGNLTFNPKKEETIQKTEEKIVQENNVAKENIKNFSTLNAHKTSTGYQLKSKDGALVFVLLKTSLPTLFFAKRNETEGVLIQKIDGWYFEYYKNENLITESIAITF